MKRLLISLLTIVILIGLTFAWTPEAAVGESGRVPKANGGLFVVGTQVVQTQDGACGGKVVVPLIAARSIEVGNVTIWNDAENLYVRYETSGSWTLTETHLHVNEREADDTVPGNDDIPQTRSGNPIIGLFYKQDTHPAAQQEFLYHFDLVQESWDFGKELYVAAQADVQLLDDSGDAIRGEGAWAAGYAFSGRNWATYFTYEIQTCTSISTEAGLSQMNIVVGESSNIAFVVNFATGRADTYNIEFRQSISPDIDGISLSTDYPPQWTADMSMSWVVNEIITGNVVGTYELTTTVEIVETGQTDSVVTAINVISGEDAPVLNPMGSSPDAIPLSCPTSVLFTTLLTGIDVAPVDIVVEEVDQSGNPIAVLGVLADDGSSGDLQAGDNVYSGAFEIASDAESVLYFRAVASFTGIVDPVYSEICMVGVTHLPTGVSPSDMTKAVVDDTYGQPAWGDETAA